MLTQADRKRRERMTRSRRALLTLPWILPLIYFGDAIAQVWLAHSMAKARGLSEDALLALWELSRLRALPNHSLDAPEIFIVRRFDGALASLGFAFALALAVSVHRALFKQQERLWNRVEFLERTNATVEQSEPAA